MSVLYWKCCNHQYVILDSFIWCLCLPIPLWKKKKKLQTVKSWPRHCLWYIQKHMTFNIQGFMFKHLFCEDEFVKENFS